MLVGVSTRRYARSLEPLPSKVKVRGVGKSAVSARFVDGLQETLTVMRLDLPESLERVLSSINLIENLFSRVREVALRVKRWQGSTMILRWTAAGVLEAERSFRKITGYRAQSKLIAALRARDLAIERERRVDNGKKAA